MGRKSRLWGAGVLLALAGVCAYRDSFRAPFVFDDEPAILENLSIRHWWPLAGPLSPPTGFGITVSGRPLLNLSLAINFAAGGFNPLGYHIGNLTIHVLAALALLGITRRTLLQTRARGSSAGWRDAAALGFVLLWMLHPLQTESVTYTIQRAESLAALFCFSALYCFIRAASPGTFTIKPGWAIASVVACLLGTGCKETIVVAPLIIGLYDRTFVAGSFVAAWRARRFYYVSLFSTWIALGILVAGTGGTRGGTFVYTPIAFLRQWMEEGPAVVSYIRLALWPAPLVFEYGPPDFMVTSGKIASDVLIIGLIVISVWFLRRRPVLGFFAATFFLGLAPASLLPGTIQVVVEHRMYLPLAALLALPLAWGIQREIRYTAVAYLGLATLAGAGTAARNRVYASDLTLWADTVRKRPQNAKALSNLGTAYYRRSQWEKALHYYAEAVQRDPNSAQAHFNYGLAAAELGDHTRARLEYAAAIKRLPYLYAAHGKLAQEWILAGNYAEAVAHLRKVVEYQPGSAQAALDLGKALLQTTQSDEARPYFLQALELDSVDGDAHFQLGLLSAKNNRWDDAETEYRRAITAQPRLVEARLNLGILLAQRGENAAALAMLREVTRQDPTLAEGWNNLGIAQADLGQTAAAVQSYLTALQRREIYPAAEYNLGNAFIQLGQITEARAHFASAVREQPDFVAAVEMLAKTDRGPR